VKTQNEAEELKTQAIVFDRDGVIFDPFDSPAAFYDSVKEFLSGKDIACPSFESYLYILKRSRRRFWTKLSLGRLKKRDFEKWWKNYQIDNMDRIVINAKLYPQVTEALEKLHAMGVQMALTSGWFGTKGTKELLSKYGIERCFKLVLTLDDYIAKMFDNKNPKILSRAPLRRSPKKKAWLITESLRTLCVKPSNAIFVGDSPEDITAGKKLGTRTIAVLTGWGERYKNRFKKMKPDMILNSIADLPDAISRL